MIISEARFEDHVTPIPDPRSLTPWIWLKVMLLLRVKGEILWAFKGHFHWDSILKAKHRWLILPAGTVYSKLNMFQYIYVFSNGLRINILYSQSLRLSFERAASWISGKLDKLQNLLIQDFHRKYKGSSLFELVHAQPFPLLGQRGEGVWRYLNWILLT